MFVDVKTETSVELPDGLSAAEALKAGEDIVHAALAADERVRLVYVNRKAVLHEAS